MEEIKNLEFEFSEIEYEMIQEFAEENNLEIQNYKSKYGGNEAIKYFIKTSELVEFEINSFGDIESRRISAKIKRDNTKIDSLYNTVALKNYLIRLKKTIKNGWAEEDQSKSK